MFTRRVLIPALFVFSPAWVASVVFATETAHTAIEIPFTYAVIDPDPPRQSHCKGVGDIDGDGFPDVLLAGATEGDGFFWYRYPDWTRYTIVPPGVAGFTTDMQVADVDGDGDLDAIISQGYHKGEHVFWYENPRPFGDPAVDPWIEHSIGKAGAHDVEVADLNNDGRLDIVVRWKQTTVFFQNTPTSWTMKVVSSRPNEGVGLGDIDGDGDTDIAINGYWLDNPLPSSDPLIDPWTEFVIDPKVTPRVGVLVTDLNEDGRTDVVIGPSESSGGRFSWYEGPAAPRSDAWVRHPIDDTAEYLHTFKTADMDFDGDLDLVTAEMPQSRDPNEVSVYLNEGDALSWHQQVVATTGSHNLRLADIDSDGDTDIIGANWQGETPFEMWRNGLDPTLSMDSWKRHVIDAERPWRAVFISSGDIDGDALPDIITGGWWYRNPGDSASIWTREAIGAPLHNMAVVHDFDGDGHLDILGTRGIGSAMNSTMAWAHNNGVGQFTVRNNIESGDGDFLQGVAVGRFQHGGNLEVVLSWHATAGGLQRLTVPQNPFQETWRWGQFSPLSLDEEVSTGDMDGDGDLDILLGMQWLRNDETSWVPMTLSPTAAGADRNRLADVNGDGRLDAIIGFEATSKLAWYEPGELATDPWVEHVISADFRSPMSLDVGDLDQDGDVDIVAGEHLLSDPTSARLAVFENVDAGATWVLHEVFTGDEHHDGTQLVDIDNDGDLDIISIGWSHNDVLLYENQSNNKDKPNVLFIAIDDLNDWVGVLGGHPQTRTPHLDQLAHQGVLFTNAHTAAPACNPSRTALLTGIRPSTSGVYGNDQPWRTALPNATTLPQYFKQHGYYMLGSGKIFHLRWPQDSASWNEYEMFWTPKTQENKNGLDMGIFDWGPILVSDSQMGDAQTVDWVISQLERDFVKPFFLACGISLPHLPWYVPPKYFEMFPEESVQLPNVKEDDLDDIPAGGMRMIDLANHKVVVENNQWYNAVQGYLASTAFMDEQLGRLLNALSQSQYADNTIIVLWSDNGWHLGEKQHWRKNALWEQSTRVPLVFVVPQGTPGLPRGTTAGQRSDQPVNLVDVYPTLIELAGLSHRQELEGISLVPLLRNPNAPRSQPSITTRGRNNHAVRSNRYRYIQYADGSEELYDHQTDPDEFVNRAKDPNYSDVIATHRLWLPKVNAPEAPYD